jgi:hypothetical protein
MAIVLALYETRTPYAGNGFLQSNAGKLLTDLTEYSFFEVDETDFDHDHGQNAAWS